MPQITNHTTDNLVALLIIQWVNACQLVVPPGGNNSNQSQSIQWTQLVKYQSEINQSQARQAIQEWNCPIRGLESQMHYQRMHKPR